jgi:hypothetical protein
MTPVIGIYRLGLLALLAVSVYSNQPCERLKATLTYTQEEAPRDLSSVVSQLVIHGCRYRYHHPIVLNIIQLCACFPVFLHLPFPASCSC